MLLYAVGFNVARLTLDDMAARTNLLAAYGTFHFPPLLRKNGTLSGANIKRRAIVLPTTLSAPHLQAGMAVVVTIFVAIILGMYSRGLRAIRQEGGRRNETSPVIDIIDELFDCEVVAPMASPFYERLERLRELHRRLDGHSASLSTS